MMKLEFIKEVLGEVLLVDPAQGYFPQEYGYGLYWF
jgi:hypothetical protein